MCSAFFANQCRREMLQFRGLSGSVVTCEPEKSVTITAEGEKAKLESFVRWCGRGVQDLALEGGKPTLGDVVYSAATGLEGFTCSDDLCDVDLLATVQEQDSDDIAESDLIAALIDELS